MTESKVTESPLEVYIRKSDLDDVEALNALITPDNKANLDQLYNYPNILNLFEK